MTHRRAHAWGAAIIAAGALLGVTAALWAGRPGSLWRSLAIALVSYAAGGALVLRWGLEVYGVGGALGAVALAAFAPGVLAALAAPPLLAPAGGTTLAGGFAQLAAIYALMRCLLDPTLQWVVLAGLIILAVPIGAFLHGSSAAAMAGLAVLSLLMVVFRILTAERCESRARVAQASAVSVGLAWSVALLAYLLVVAVSHLRSAEEYSGAPPPPARVASRSLPPLETVDFRVRVAAALVAAPHRRLRWPVRTQIRRLVQSELPANGGGARGQALRLHGGGDPRSNVREVSTDPSPPRPAPSPAWPALWAAGLPLAVLLLAAVRPWRRQRRFTDAGWSAALLCLGGPLWLAWGEPGGVFMAPVAALLAGACWDAARPAWARHVATLVVVVQMAAALLLWPRYPGGVRPDAWLPMPGICLEDFSKPAAACPIAGRILLTSRAGPAAHPDWTGDREDAP